MPLTLASLLADEKCRLAAWSSACARGDVGAVEELLEHGYNPREDRLKATPSADFLADACGRQGSAAVVRLLVGLDDGRRLAPTPAHLLAAVCGSGEAWQEIFDALVAGGANPGEGAFETLCAAVRHQRSGVIKQMLAGGNVALGENGHWLLALAANGGDLPTFEALVTSGHRFDLESDEALNTILHELTDVSAVGEERRAQVATKTAMLDLLLDNGYDTPMARDYMVTGAATSRSPEIIEHLLGRGIDPHYVTRAAGCHSAFYYTVTTSSMYCQPILDMKRMAEACLATPSTREEHRAQYRAYCEAAAAQMASE